MWLKNGLLKEIQWVSLKDYHIFFKGVIKIYNFDVQFRGQV